MKNCDLTRIIQSSRRGSIPFTKPDRFALDPDMDCFEKQMHTAFSKVATGKILVNKTVFSTKFIPKKIFNAYLWLW